MSKDNHLTILLSADHDEERDILSNVLAGQGYIVSKIDNLKDKVEAYHEVLPALVIIAESGPDVCANEASRRLKEEAEIDDIPVLVICDRRSSLESLSGSGGMSDYLRRPFEREDILARIKILLRVSRQVVELRDMREKLHTAQKLECVGALAAGVAHEFNNMMCAVLGFAELALQDGANDMDSLRESAEVSSETAKRATAAARSLLAFSRQAASVKAKGNLNDAVSAAVRLLVRDMDKSGIKTVVELGELPEINFAIGSIQQVFLNLIINSWHAMTGWNGEKTVTIRTWTDNNQKVCASVADTGMGIPASRHEKIFEPFFTTKTAEEPGQVKGSGLGLSIVKEVVRDHGGTIYVESEEGKGAKFILTFPVESMVADASHSQTFNTESYSLPFQRKYSILVVDDDEQNRKTIARLLKKNGHRALVAGNMAEAIPLIWGNKLDLIVLDLVMPGASGDENVKSLREQGIDMPIMICTGNLDGISIKKALEAGANGVVTKPFSGYEFLSEMQECLSGSRSQGLKEKN